MRMPPRPALGLSTYAARWGIQNSCPGDRWPPWEPCPLPVAPPPCFAYPTRARVSATLAQLGTTPGWRGGHCLVDVSCAGWIPLTSLAPALGGGRGGERGGAKGRVPETRRTPSCRSYFLQMLGWRRRGPGTNPRHLFRSHYPGANSSCRAQGRALNKH